MHELGSNVESASFFIIYSIVFHISLGVSPSFLIDVSSYYL